MSISVANAQRYIAKTLGGQNDSNVLAMAAEAIQRAYEEWEAANSTWNFLLRDTSAGFTVPAVTLTNSTTVNTPSPGAFDGINPGITVAGTGITGGTTVSSITRAADGTVASIILSIAASSGSNITLTFGGDIPIVAATQEYNLPPDFRTPYHLRFLTGKTPLDFIQYKHWDRRVLDHTSQTTPKAYTVYNPVSALGQNYGIYRLRLFPIPTTADTATMQYYRKFNRTTDPLDIPDQFLYKFLDTARLILVRTKNATDDRLPLMEQDAANALKTAIDKDSEIGMDDEGLALLTQNEDVQSVTRTAAKLYLARAVGGMNDPNVIAMADEAIRRAYEDWEMRKNWNFLLKDTSVGFRVPACQLTNGNPVISAPTPGAFDGVNIGVSISGTHVPGATTVSNLTRNTDGSVATITMSHNASGTSSAAGDTMIFGGDIPLSVSVQEYNLPNDFRLPYHARLLTNATPLDYIQYKNWNRRVTDQTLQGTPVAYTMYNPNSADTQRYGNYRLRLFRIPSAIDTLTIQYYRRFIKEADPLDIPAQFLYNFLDYAQARLVEKRIPLDERLAQSYGGQNAVKAAAENAETILQMAMAKDDLVGQEDEGLALNAQLENTRSMTRAQARLFLARAVGGADDPGVVVLADEAIRRAIEEWEGAEHWNWLLRDTQAGFVVPACSLDGVTAVIPAPSVGAFDAVNIGVAITGTGIAANSTVLSFTQAGPNNTIDTITLNHNTTANSISDLTFSGDIPLIAGTQEYNLPADFRHPYHARLLGTGTIGTVKAPLDYIQYSHWDRRVTDHTATGAPIAYTVYNPVSAESQNAGTYRLRLFKIPSGTPGTVYDTLTLQYYRKVSRSADPIDIPEQYIYKFLDVARLQLLKLRNAVDERLPSAQQTATEALQSATLRDQSLVTENDGLSLFSQVDNENYITRTAAKLYIAKGIGAPTEVGLMAEADEALRAGFEHWEAAKNWYFLLKDSTGGFIIPLCVLSGSSAVVSPPFPGAFDGVNVGVGVSGTGVAANTTVLSYARNTDGTVKNITLSSTPSAGTVSLTFTGDIPLISQTQEYNLPNDFRSPYHMRMTEKKLPLEYIQYRYWNMKITDHTVQGLPIAYTTYNPTSADTQNYGAYRFRLFRIPNGTAGLHYDTVTLQYYRKLNRSSDPIDIPSIYINKFLDYCRWLMLDRRNPADPRLPNMKAAAASALQSAMTKDEEQNEEEEQTRLVSQMEAGPYPRPTLWTNGQFTLYYGDYS